MEKVSGQNNRKFTVSADSSHYRTKNERYTLYVNEITKS